MGMSSCGTDIVGKVIKAWAKSSRTAVIMNMAEDCITRYAVIPAMRIVGKNRTYRWKSVFREIHLHLSAYSLGFCVQLSPRTVIFGYSDCSSLVRRLEDVGLETLWKSEGDSLPEGTRVKKVACEGQNLGHRLSRHSLRELSD